MKILGLSFGYHDSSAALIVDGKIICADQEERFSRLKHDAGFPAAAIEFCLARGGIEVYDLDQVVYYENHYSKLERIVSMVGFLSFDEAAKCSEVIKSLSQQYKLDPISLIRERLGVSRRKISLSNTTSLILQGPFFHLLLQKSRLLLLTEWANLKLRQS